MREEMSFFDEAMIWGGLIAAGSLVGWAWRAAFRAMSSPAERPAAPLDCGYCNRSLELLDARAAFAHLAACAAGGDGGVHAETETSIDATTAETSETTERHWTEVGYRCPRSRAKCGSAARRRLCGFAALAFLSFLGCRTPDPAPAAASTSAIDWRARAEAIVDAHWPNVEEIRGLIIVEYCRLTNPIGEFAGLSESERRAAIIELAEGWDAGLSRRGGR